MQANAPLCVSGEAAAQKGIQIVAAVHEAQHLLRGKVLWLYHLQVTLHRLCTKGMPSCVPACGRDPSHSCQSSDLRVSRSFWTRCRLRASLLACIRVAARIQGVCRTCALCTRPSSKSRRCMLSNTRIGKRWLAGNRSATGEEYLGWCTMGTASTPSRGVSHRNPCSSKQTLLVAL